jgi:hypothetical protein
LPGINGLEYEEATYEGNFKAGKREGFGIMTWSDGSHFQGIWRNDKRHEGEMKMANGNIYRGPFIDEKYHGSGMLLLQRENVIFQGQFTEGKFSSVGKLLYNNGDVFYGQHKQFIREGLGKMVTLKGTVYEGNWELDRKNGKGRLIDGLNGDIFIGEFQDGKKQGRGLIYHKSTEEIYDGEWSADNKNGEAYVLHRNGRLDQVEYRSNQMEGKSQPKQVLSAEEVDRIFTLVTTQREAFISVPTIRCSASAMTKMLLARKSLTLSLF